MGLRISQWKTKLRAGSFRGAAFKIRSHQKEGGRRVQEHEFPQLEQNRSEDLGRKIGRFTLDLYVIADDYFPARNALEAALLKEGPGELIHPYLGRMTVQAGDYVLSETVDEGRIARFTVKFSEAGSGQFPQQLVDSIASVSSGADEFITSSTSSFEDIYSVANAPAFVVQSAADALTKVADFAETAIKKVTQPVANLTFALRNLRTSAEDLVQLPGELSERLKSFFEDLLEEFQNDQETASRISKQFKNLEDEYEDVIGETPSRTKERINQQATIDLTKDLAFASQSKSVSETAFASTQEAVAERDELIDNLDERAMAVADNEGDDDLYQTNKDLQAALIKAVPQTGLSELITFTPAQTMPALVIAHTIFGNIDKEQEIIDQNEIEHPGFAPGNEEIEVSGG